MSRLFDNAMLRNAQGLRWASRNRLPLEALPDGEAAGDITLLPDARMQQLADSYPRAGATLHQPMRARRPGRRDQAHSRVNGGRQRPAMNGQL
ncbi:MAG: hypothetical protein U5L02_06510 [Rheinheimera sp.]|nr:hypothetical protein [Rheinheimera sp.]